MISTKYENYGLSTEKDFIRTLQRQELNKKYEASGVPLYYSKGAAYTDAADSHTLIFGTTGTKKTRNFIIPSVFTLGMAGESMVISDPKGEIYRYTSGFLKSEGYDIKVFNLRDPKFSSTWNPLLLPYRYYKSGDKDKCVELLYDFCTQLKTQIHTDDDPYWELQAMDLMIGIILLLFETEPDESRIHMESVVQIRMEVRPWIDPRYEPSDAQINSFWKIVEGLPEDSLIRYKLASAYSLRKTEKTLNCVISCFDGMISCFVINKKLMNMLSSNEIDFDTISTRKTALFLIIPDEKTTFHFLVSVFVKQCYEVLIDYAQSYPDGTLPVRVNYLLDEFSNFPRIGDMPSMISAARSRNIRFVLVVQSKQQLQAAYKDDAETIKSNCRNWIYLSCRELSLLEEIQSICGMVEVDGKTIPVLTITDLQRLEIGREDSQALILRPGISPFVSWVKDFSFYPQSHYQPVRFVVRDLPEPKHFSVNQYVYHKFEFCNERYPH